MPHAAQPDFHTRQSRFPPLAENAAELVAGARRALDHDPHVARGYLDQLAALLRQSERATRAEAILVPAAPARGQSDAPVKGGLASWQSRRVTRHIDEHLGGTITVEMLADIARLSGGHFCRAFKVTTGETPHAFLIRQRVRRAQILMLRTDDTLSQIACACGLTDQAHLTRLFRRMVGETPLIWRRTWQPAR